MSSSSCGGSTPRLWGQPMFAAPRSMTITVQPHGCGDNMTSATALTSRPGSTPRLWGQPPSTSPRFPCVPVQPHGCGDNAALRLHPAGVARFNPTAVGTTSIGETRELKTDGSTPRLWGQPVSGCSSISPNAVQPHGCGDNSCSRLKVVVTSRFNPTAVGTTPVESVLSFLHDRFNPTAVGTTPGSWLLFRNGHKI